jgi:hypothetical protein
MLPEQRFLLVATRRSGTLFEPSPNVTLAGLEGYAVGRESKAEYEALVLKWEALRKELRAVPEFAVLFRAGVLDKFPYHLRNGLAARNAWQRVLTDEQVVAVMCGDDSNPYTRLPVDLARKQGIRTVDFHHGAMDGRFLMKELPSDLYLAKSEMERDYLVRVCDLPAERVALGAPAATANREAGRRGAVAPSVAFFSEPYEVSGGRPEEIYRELMPILCRVAAENGKDVIIKLHPFESPAERLRILDRVLSAAERSRVRIESGPLSDNLLEQIWFGMTVESTTVMDCTERGVPCFLCEWLGGSRFGYVAQYARFGVGRLLHSAAEVAEIPKILALSTEPVKWKTGAARPMTTEQLLRVLSVKVFSTPFAQR